MSVADDGIWRLGRTILVGRVASVDAGLDPGRALLRKLTARLTGLDASTIVIEAQCHECAGAHGRPRVVAPSLATSIHLSLARTPNAVYAAASMGRSIGIDAESSDAGRGPALQTIRAAIRDIAGPVTGSALTHWTRVEAVLKADGRGLAVDPRLVQVRGRRHPKARVAGSARRYRLHEPLIDETARVSVAVEV